jgi:hypothetical protein
VSETNESLPAADADERPIEANDIPSIVPDPEAPLRGEVVPDDWLDQKVTTASGRPGGYGRPS